MFFPSRRNFIKTAVAAIASFFLPKSLRAGEPARSFWFLHKPSGESWRVDDPVAWSLENAGQAVLERARERLLTLDASDPQRVIRLVVRRCGFNLLEVQSGRVVVHYWGLNGSTDLRPFFKRHGLGRQDVEVVSIDRKREHTAVLRGDDFLFGDRLAQGFPLALYENKWRRRSTEDEDDWQAAPWSRSNYCWEGIEERCIPWSVLKSAWRRENGPPCPNCDTPLAVTSFGYFACGYYKRGPRVTRVCPLCRRAFEDDSPWDGPKWLLANLDESLLPSWDMMFTKPVRWTLPWTPEGQAHERGVRLVHCLNRIEGRSRHYVEPNGKIVRIGKRGTVTLLPFDGPEDRMEEWCRNVLRLLADEG